MLRKMSKKLKSAFIKFIARVFGVMDRLLLVPFFDFDAYFNIHKKLGFPVKKLYFLSANGYMLNLKIPKKFNEKVAYRHLFERNSLLQTVVDKYDVREYVQRKIGGTYLIPIIGIYEKVDEIDFSNLPSNYILKSTHGSGQNIICKNNHTEYTVSEIRDILIKWQTEKYGYQKLIYFVQPLKRRIIIEELLLTEEDKIPKDYKLFVFNGKVEIIQVDKERFENHTRNIYDSNWKKLELSVGYENSILDEKPSCLETMIQVAEKLASNFTFMRVDLYVLEDKIYFGELTPCPGGALEKFIPHKFDDMLGDKWGNSLSLLTADNG